MSCRHLLKAAVVYFALSTSDLSFSDWKSQQYDSYRVVWGSMMFIFSTLILLYWKLGGGMWPEYLSVEAVIELASVVVFPGQDLEMESSHYLISHECKFLAGEKPKLPHRGSAGVRGGATGGTLHVSESRCV